MGRFEKKIQKRIQLEMEDFEKWFEKNESQFPQFCSDSIIRETGSDGIIRIKKRKIWLIPIAFLIVGLCIFFCLFNKMPQKSPMYFGDELVHYEKLNMEEQNDLLEKNTFLSKFINTAFDKIAMNEDSATVFVIVQGELATETDYYFATIQFEYNPYYNFLDKVNYEELQNEINYNGYTISYESQGLDINELCWYYMLTEKSGQKIYWDIHCFSESIDIFIETVLK